MNAHTERGGTRYFFEDGRDKTIVNVQTKGCTTPDHSEDSGSKTGLNEQTERDGTAYLSENGRDETGAKAQTEGGGTPYL